MEILIIGGPNIDSRGSTSLIFFQNFGSLVLVLYITLHSSLNKESKMQ